MAGHPSPSSLGGDVLTLGPRRSGAPLPWPGSVPDCPPQLPAHRPGRALLAVPPPSPPATLEPSACLPRQHESSLGPHESFMAPQKCSSLRHRATAGGPFQRHSQDVERAGAQQPWGRGAGVGQAPERLGPESWPQRPQQVSDPGRGSSSQQRALPPAPPHMPLHTPTHPYTPVLPTLCIYTHTPHPRTHPPLHPPHSHVHPHPTLTPHPPPLHTTPISTTTHPCTPTHIHPPSHPSILPIPLLHPYAPVHPPPHPHYPQPHRTGEGSTGVLAERGRGRGKEGGGTEEGKQEESRRDRQGGQQEAQGAEKEKSWKGTERKAEQSPQRDPGCSPCLPLEPISALVR